MDGGSEGRSWLGERSARQGYRVQCVANCQGWQCADREGGPGEGKCGEVWSEMWEGELQDRGAEGGMPFIYQSWQGAEREGGPGEGGVWGSVGSSVGEVWVAGRGAEGGVPFIIKAGNVLNERVALVRGSVGKCRRNIASPHLPTPFSCSFASTGAVAASDPHAAFLDAVHN